MRTIAAVSRVAPSITAPRTLRARNHAALSSPKCAAALSCAASTSTDSVGTAPSIARKRRRVWSRSRGTGEEPGRQVGEPTMGDQNLDDMRHPLLVTRRQAPGAVVGGERPRRHVAPAERVHGGLGGQRGAPEAVEDPFARERIEEAG